MISIIVPVFNSEKFLKRCINNLVNQEDIEIILINDASTDNSFKIMESFKKKFQNKIKLINSKKNLKQGGARNLGILSATKEYIGFVDSDDWTKPSMFKEFIKIAKNKNPDMIGCQYFSAYSKKKISPKKNPNSDFLIKVSDKKLTKKDKEMLLFSISTICCHIYRRSIILENKIFFLENTIYEDNHFVRLYTLYIKKYIFLNKYLYFYFQNPNSTTNQRNKFCQFDRLEVERKKIEDYKKRKLFDKYKNGIEIDFIKTFYINTVILIFNSFDNPDIKKVKILKKEALKFFPNYRRNPYYNIISKKDKFKIFLAEKFPKVLLFLYRYLKAF